MNSSLLGLALLPEESARRRLVNFRSALNEFLDEPELGIETSIPHVSVLQCPFAANALTEDKLGSLVAQFRAGGSANVRQATLGRLYHQPRDWIFVETIFDSWILGLQNLAITLLESEIDRDSIDLDRDFEGYTTAEARNFKTYGYRYVGESFRPHITLGRRPSAGDGSLPAQLMSAYARELKGSVVTFDQMVFYRAGAYGSLAQILAEVSID